VWKFLWGGERVLLSEWVSKCVSCKRVLKEKGSHHVFHRYFPRLGNLLTLQRPAIFVTHLSARAFSKKKIVFMKT
jgi:hypothetical protein